MQTGQVDFETIDQQIGVFGLQDSNIKQIEKTLSVQVSLRDSKVEVRGEEEGNIDVAVAVMNALKRIYNSGEIINDDVVSRTIELVRNGEMEDAFRAMTNVVAITHRGQPIKCKTIGQKNYVKALNDNTVTICIGPAGTGKTFLAVAAAVTELKKGTIDRIVMSRPAIEAGEERLGFLPGDLSQKVDPYLRPLYDALDDILGVEQVKKYQERGVIEIAPLAYMRGRTLNRAMVLIDESQNASLPTLKMALTRLGEGSRMILTGDVTQIDLPKVSDSGLERCASILNGIESIAVIRLSNRDVVRHKLVRDIVKAFEREEKREEEKRGKTSFKKN